MRESYQASEEDVLSLLRKKGYNFLVSRNYRVQLTRPDPHRSFAISGAPYQQALGGVNHAQWSHIMRWALDSAEAAEQVERICLGVIKNPEVGPRQQAAPAAIDQHAIEKLAESRASQIAASSMAEVNALKAQLRQELESIQKLKDEIKNPPKPKLGRPKGSKNKPKAKGDEPELTEAQEAELAKVQFGPN